VIERIERGIETLERERERERERVRYLNKGME
jgi:hypothetical protein